MKKGLFISILLVILNCNLACAASENIEAILNKQLKVVYNNEIQEFKNVKGEKVYPISYQGSTYLPIRSISSLFNTKIKWDGNTKSIYLGEGDEDTTSAQKSTKFIPQEPSNIDAILNEEIKIYYNNAIQSFKDEGGKVIYPISYQGTTYLPVRAVSNLFDLDIGWDGVTKTVTISEKNVDVETEDISTNNEPVIPNIPTESFASRAEEHTTSMGYMTEVGIVYTNSGIDIVENGSYLPTVSPIYIEFANIYDGENATKIIENYNNKAQNSELMPYTISNGRKVYCALFNVDLKDYIYDNNPNGSFIAMSFSPMGSVNVTDLSSGQILTTNLTIIQGETNKMFYKTGDITQLYAVFSVPNEVSVSAIQFNFFNENNNSAEKFFKSYLF